MNYTYQTDGYKPNGEIFVFGANVAGRHGAGAAAEAYRRYGAVMGIGFGMGGWSFAIPTKDANIMTMHPNYIAHWVDKFKQYATENLHRKFYVSRIGCGLAGHTDAVMAPLFIGSPSNCSFAEEWKPWLG